MLAPLLAIGSEQCTGEPLVIRDGEGHHNITSCFYYYQDQSRELTLQDMLGRNAPEFNHHTSGILNYGYTESVFWVRRTVIYRNGGDPVAPTGTSLAKWARRGYL